MTWLIWKDYRLNRLILIVAIVLLLMPYLGVITGETLSLAENLLGVSYWSLTVLQFMLAFMGGNAIAGERADRSAEFLASLPISRRRILTSKLIVSLGLGVLVLIPNLVILLVYWSGMKNLAYREEPAVIAAVTITGLTFFCVAWLFSSILESPTFSVCAGLIAPFLVMAGMLGTILLVKCPGTHFLLWYSGICVAISAVSFAGGTLYYLHRIEP